jgi:hypothetical protein
MDIRDQSFRFLSSNGVVLSPDAAFFLMSKTPVFGSIDTLQSAHFMLLVPSLFCRITAALGKTSLILKASLARAFIAA